MVAEPTAAQPRKQQGGQLHDSWRFRQRLHGSGAARPGRKVLEAENQQGRQEAEDGLPAGEEKLQALGAATVPEAFKSPCSSLSDLN